MEGSTLVTKGLAGACARSNVFYLYVETPRFFADSKGECGQNSEGASTFDHTTR